MLRNMYVSSRQALLEKRGQLQRTREEIALLQRQARVLEDDVEAQKKLVEDLKGKADGAKASAEEISSAALLHTLLEECRK